MTYTFDDATFSDLHKDAFGFRPSEHARREWRLADDAAKQKIWDALIIALGVSIERDNERAKQAVAIFEGRIAELIALGADDRACAIRWIHQAEISDGTSDQLEWLLDLPFGYLSR